MTEYTNSAVEGFKNEKVQYKAFNLSKYNIEGLIQSSEIGSHC